MFVVSFYSYKGGVGRTVALLNVAWNLAVRGVRVALIDLDLEAPGLQAAHLRPTSDGGWEPPAPQTGFADLVTDYRSARIDAVAPSLGRYLVEGLGPGGRMALLPASGSATPRYEGFVQSFSWRDFYDSHERPGKHAMSDIVRGFADLGYDYVLIDGRTGLTDVRGVTLVDLPDLVVMVTNLSRQSVEGTKGQLAQVERVNERIRGGQSSPYRRVGRERSVIQRLVVASPVPRGEWLLRSRCLRAALDQLAGVDPELASLVVVEHSPILALDEERQIVAQLDADGAENGLFRTMTRPYDELADAIVRCNPTAPDHLVAQGRRLFDLGRWREAMAHFDEVVDRHARAAEGAQAPSRDETLALAKAGKIRAQLQAITQVDEATAALRALDSTLDTGVLDRATLVDLHLSATWALVVAERFGEAAHHAARALELVKAAPPGRSGGESLETECSLFLGQALNLACRFADAQAVLDRAEVLCRHSANRPLLHCLVLIEQARVYAQSGPMEHAASALRHLEELIEDTPIASTYLGARVGIAAGEVNAELGRGNTALGALRGSFDAFLQETDKVGALEALLGLATLEPDMSAAFRSSELDWGGWTRVAADLSTHHLASRLALQHAERYLAQHGQAVQAPLHAQLRQDSDPADGTGDPLFMGLVHLHHCRVAIVRGELQAARDSLDAARSLPVPLAGEVGLLSALIAVASGIRPEIAWAVDLETQGFTMRLLVASVVLSLSLDEHVSAHWSDRGRALRDTVEPLDGWLWNLPIAFAMHAPALRDRLRTACRLLALPWPEPTA